MDTTKDKKTVVFAVSGIKNSGKTTLITKIIPRLKAQGLSVATVKHDGHDFDCDVEGRDTYKHINSGACATAIFSKSKYMIINNKPEVKEDFFIEHFSDKDVIILEGFKFSSYKKIEVVRKGISDNIVCDPSTLLAIATDIENINIYENHENIDNEANNSKDAKIEEKIIRNIDVVDINDMDSIIEVINSYIREGIHDR